MKNHETPSAAEPHPKESNELHGLNKLHEVEEFARAAQILADSSTKNTKGAGWLHPDGIEGFVQADSSGGSIPIRVFRVFRGF